MEEFTLGSFINFCSILRIEAKEHLGFTPLKMFGTQKYVMDEITQGLAAGVHNFTILKGRQQGISTILQALDLYWLFRYKGMQGGLITQDEPTLVTFRSMFDSWMSRMQENVTRPKIKHHNRILLELGNGSRMSYMVAGNRKGSGLGRSKALTFAHGTECAYWGDVDGYNALMNTLAENNPMRLFVWESTANGYNTFEERWNIAKRSDTQKAIFVGWWRHDYYRKARDSVEFKQYWDGKPTSDERVWIKAVFKMYHHEITPEQLAWWRWYKAEKANDDEAFALQEHPPTEEYAFKLTGNKFFNAERVNQNYQRAKKLKPRYFRYTFGPNFEDTKFEETNEVMAHVAIWEWPEPRGVYSLGADPAYGSSENADQFAATILRCYSDKAVQVVELCTDDFADTRQYTWAICHLAGFYGGPRGNCMLSLELQGPGGAVWNEIINLRRLAGTYLAGDPRRQIFQVLTLIRDFLYKRQDSMGRPSVYQWQTNTKEKGRVLNQLKSYFNMDRIVINSTGCLEEFRKVTQSGDKIEAEGSAKDDRVMALAIAAIPGWNDTYLPELEARRMSFESENRPPEAGPTQTVLERTVSDFYKQAGVKVR